VRFLCFFGKGRLAVPLPDWASDVTRDTILRRASAATATVEGGMVAATFPPVIYTQVIGLSCDRADVSASAASLARDLGALVVCQVDRSVKLDGAVPDGYVKNVGLLRRAAHLDRAGFDQHWNGPHAALAVEHNKQFVRYATNVVRDVAGDFDWDGVAEQWFPSEEALALHIDISAPGRKVMADDAATMVSVSDTMLAVAQ
jgi:EthD domain